MALWLRRSRLQWVRVNPDGFTLIDSKGETEFQDLQVEGFALDWWHNEPAILRQSITRILTLSLDETANHDRSRLLQFSTTYPSHAVDPLDVLIARLHTHVLQQARARLAGGQAFSGNGWRIDGDNLVFSSGPPPRECPLDDIAMVAIVDRELRIWRTGQDNAWAGVRIKNVNVYVLKTLLDEHLQDRPGEDERMSDSDSHGGTTSGTTSGGETDGDSLGRLIFERRAQGSSWVILSLLSFALPLGGLSLIIPGQNNRLQNHWAMQFWGGVLLLAGLACILGLIYSARYFFRRHERGLLCQGLLKKRKLLYEHIKAFRYRAVPQFVNGVYVGTTFVLDFEPDAEHRSQRIRYAATLRNSDEDLGHLSDLISRILAERMLREVAAGQRVQWTPALAFERENLLYAPLGLLGRKSTVSIPLTQIDRYELNQGKCRLFRRGEGRAVASESVTTRNFFPGLFCLLSLISNQQEEPLPMPDFE